MSDICPNCLTPDCGSYDYPGGSRCTTQTCITRCFHLIRSLREELAAARDAERDQIAGWLKDNPRFQDDGWFNTSDHIEIAIRNNEHRSEQ